MAKYIPKVQAVEAVRMADFSQYHGVWPEWLRGFAYSDEIARSIGMETRPRPTWAVQGNNGCVDWFYSDEAFHEKYSPSLASD